MPTPPRGILEGSSKKPYGQPDYYKQVLIPDKGCPCLHCSCIFHIALRLPAFYAF